MQINISFVKFWGGWEQTKIIKKLFASNIHIWLSIQLYISIILSCNSDII